MWNIFKVNNKRDQNDIIDWWIKTGVFIVNFEYISHPFLKFVLFTLNK